MWSRDMRDALDLFQDDCEQLGVFLFGFAEVAVGACGDQDPPLTEPLHPIEMKRGFHRLNEWICGWHFVDLIRNRLHYIFRDLGLGGIVRDGHAGIPKVSRLDRFRDVGISQRFQV